MVTLCFLKYLLKKKKQCQYDMFVSFSGPCSNLITVHDSSVSSYSSLDYSGSWWQVNWCRSRSLAWESVKQPASRVRKTIYPVLGSLVRAGQLVQLAVVLKTANPVHLKTGERVTFSPFLCLAVASQHQGILWSKQMGVNFGNFTFDVIWCWISSNSSPVS